MKNRSFLLILRYYLKITMEISGIYKCLDSITLFIFRIKKYGFF